MIDAILHASLRACILAPLLLPPTLASAEPITLKFAFFTSDRSQIYQAELKPFVDAVNADGQGIVHIDVYFSNAISNVESAQPQIVSDGTADMAMVVLGSVGDRFHDTLSMALPGMFRTSREGSRVFEQLAQGGLLEGYEDYFVIGAWVSDPENIHSRKPVASLADLKGLTVRVNNSIEAKTLERFGAIPVLLPVNTTNDAMGKGIVDAVAIPPFMLFEFGLNRVTTYHYMIGLGGAPTALLMNRKKFESLPPAAQAIIRKYSGAWLIDRSTSQLEALDRRMVEHLKSDSRRSVVFPSPEDSRTIYDVYRSVVAEFSAASDHNRELVDRIEAEIVKLRAGE